MDKKPAIYFRHVANELTKRSEDTDSLRIEYINCKLKKVADTEYRIFAELINKLGGEVPKTGLPTDEVYKKFIDMIEKNKEKLFIIILDEIDQAVKKISDDFLYNLMRLNSELGKTQISIIGISNDVKFLEMIDPRVKSSLSEEEIVFPPYNALQLQDILRKRAEEAFKSGVVSDGVIAKCAAYAAREHGDARRALDLLRDKFKEGIFTGDVFDFYYDLCKKTNNEALTQRRVSDILAEFDMIGLISARVISKGRQGRMREIKLAIPENLVTKSRDILISSLDLN